MGSLFSSVARIKLFALIAIIFLAGCGSGGSGGPLCQQVVGGVAVSGTARYEKRLFDANGFTGQVVLLPIRNAPVEVQRSSGKVVGSTITDDSGRYCMAYPKESNQSFGHVVVYARHDPTNVQVGLFLFDEVEEKFRFTDHHFFKTFPDDDNTFSVELDLTATAGTMGGIFNIMDTMAKGHRFFQAVTGNTPPKVHAASWEEIPGSFFVTQEECEEIVEGGVLGVEGDCIFIRADGFIFFGESFGDLDNYDDDIILHEYGHFLTHNFSKDVSRGGTHTLFDSSQDVRLAWSEGWATFFSSAMRSNPVNVDVGVDGTPNFSFSIDSNELLFPEIPNAFRLRDLAVRTTNELAVASVLWDIFDGAGDEAFDTLSLGFGPIWDVLGFWRETDLRFQTIMDNFWGVFGEVTPSFATITNDRKMEFFRDVYEPDNDMNTGGEVNLNQVEHHTLYPAGDVDFMAFSAIKDTSYIVETLNLKNGADTALRIEDSQGVILVQNDDMNYGATQKVFSDGCNTWVCGSETSATGQCLFVPRATPACPNAELVLPVDSNNLAVFPFGEDNPFPSRVEFIAPADGIFYAKVFRSPKAPPSVGILGSYDFRITKQ